ncbi:hypothetical protein QYF36_023044 [Acer negundo]|nr:hypothetical protein QYF36_023044 [Acer negundo]
MRDFWLTGEPAQQLPIGPRIDDCTPLFRGLAGFSCSLRSRGVIKLCPHILRVERNQIFLTWQAWATRASQVTIDSVTLHIFFISLRVILRWGFFTRKRDLKRSSRRAHSHRKQRRSHAWFVCGRYCLIMLVTPVMVWFAVLVSDVCKFNNNDDHDHVSMLSQLGDSVHDPEK